MKIQKSMKIKVTAVGEKIRFTIPAKELRNIDAKTNDYVNVDVRKETHTTNFYVSISSISPSRTNLQVKRDIPKSFVKETTLKAGDIVEINISLVENKRSTELIKNNKLDMLAVIPKKTNFGRSVMVDLFNKNGEEYCRVWYCSGQGGNAKPIELKRYIEIDRRLGEFFGLMQAESRKNGHKFDFTNNLVSEHNLFTNIAERFGISKNLWKYEVFYNPTMSKKDTNKQVSIFKKALSINKKVIFVQSKTLTKVALAIYIDSNILAIIMIAALLMLRSKIANSIETKELREFAIGFICKDLLGDGTVTYVKDYSNTSIVISEEEPNSQNDISQILLSLGIKTNIVKNKIHLATNFDTYPWFIENKVFEGHTNRKKLINAILSNHYIKSLYCRFKKNIPYTASEFSKEHNLLLSTAQMFLRRNKIRGFLTYEKNKRSNIYKLSNKGQNFIRLIKNAEKELITLL